MRKPFFSIFVYLIISSCGNIDKSPDLIEDQSVKTDINGGLIESLIGHWARINNGEKEQTFEYWQNINDQLTGLGFTLVGEDTVFKEVLAIVEDNGSRYYDVRGVNPDPTLFLFVEASEKGFVCVNDSNKFPKRIEYRFFGDSMAAIISAGDQKIEFEFERMD